MLLSYIAILGGKSGTLEGGRVEVLTNAASPRTNNYLD